MDSLLSGELLVALDDLFHHLVGLGLLKFFFQFEVLFEITVTAVLHDDVQTALRVEHLVQLDDVWVLELVQNADLVVDSFLQIPVFLQSLEIHLLYGYFLFCIVLKPLEDLSE